MDIDSLFSLFLREKQYLANSSPRTLHYYKWCFGSFKKTLKTDELSKAALQLWVLTLREAGLQIPSVNSYARGVNSFLSWLYENEYIQQRLRIKILKEPEKVLKVFSDQQLRALLSWKPKGFCQQRLYALVTLIIDTGCRIDECLSLTRSGLDFDNLLVTVQGKGSKERIIPFSLECRKVLFKFLQKHEHNLVFPTKDGAKVTYRNSVRNFKVLCKKQGISDVRTSWHTLRHGYALNHIRQGGDVFSLQRILGHSDLSVTKRYVGLTENDLKLVHKKTSILGRLK